MRAYLCHAFGPLDQHHAGQLPDPTPADDEVIVQVEAAGVNYYDTLIVQGRYQLKPGLPFSPGGEFAGRISAIGAQVEGFQLGQRVLAFNSFGGYAEKARAKARQVFPLPDEVASDVAAAALVAYATAWHALHDRARMQPGETVLVLGAAGGVGLAAVQIARAAGCRVIAAASSDDKLALCAESGACLGINYREQALKEAVKAATAGRGADIVVDVVGDAYTEAAVRATAWRGRVLIIGFAAGEIPRVPANLLLLKGCDLLGVFWDEFLRREPESCHRQVAAVLAGIADGTLRPPIQGRYPIEHAGEALRVLAERRATGKLLITP
ncbi:NADPH:quinone oxidoreductase family protein [Zoogloea sp.]|uniref:NADPH:quinone oxidoreductase family protein n=1 Tax=Zoogloea sp. TaxID=49181 RepID=UPI0026245398|nr:NADPH:quinone oxidoreductase family protein [Zoogloea sp.]MDD3354875.1 NADPH:quinone oxidoreductase family protein [Zoogloea sp.]